MKFRRCLFILCLLVLLLHHSLAAVLVFQHPEPHELMSNYEPVFVSIFTETKEIALFEIKAIAECIEKPGKVEEVLITNVREGITHFNITGEFVHRCAGYEMKVMGILLKQSDDGSYKFAYSDELQFQVDSTLITRLSIAIATLSAISTMCVMYLIARHPSLQEFPSGLIFWRLFSECILAFCNLYMSVSIDIYASPLDKCNFALSFFSETALMASSVYYVCIAMNFYYAISNPFFRPNVRTSMQHFYIWLLSISFGIFVGSHYGLNHANICAMSNSSNLNLISVPIVVLCICACVYVVVGEYVSDKGKFLSKYHSRKTAMIRTSRFYISISTCVMILLSVGLFTTFQIDESGYEYPQNPSVVMIVAILYSGLGFVDVLSFIVIQRKILKKLWISRSLQQLRQLRKKDALLYLEADDDEEDEFEQIDTKDTKDISALLRYEFTVTATEGIFLSSKRETRNTRKRNNTIENDDAHNDYIDVKLLSEQDNIALSSGHKFTTYAPRVFSNLRTRAFGVDGEIFQKSFIEEKGSNKDLCSNFSEGKSGCFFYFSHDRKYMIKTIPYGEVKFMLEFLEAYFIHMRKYPKSLIAQFYGLYCINIYNIPFYLVVMNNAFYGASNLKLDEIFDLKGSVIGRTGDQPNRRTGKTYTLKDNDWQGRKLIITHDESDAILTQVKRDVTFLCEKNIMDYSLLVGIHHCSQVHNMNMQCISNTLNNLGKTHETTHILSEKGKTKELASSVIVGPGMYYISIIDIMQKWNWNKRLELYAKTIFLCHWFDWKLISAVEPELYSRRFLAMMKSIVKSVNVE